MILGPGTEKTSGHLVSRLVRRRARTASADRKWGAWSADFALGVYGHHAAFRGRVRHGKDTLTTNPGEVADEVEAD